MSYRAIYLLLAVVILVCAAIAREAASPERPFSHPARTYPLWPKG